MKDFVVKSEDVPAFRKMLVTFFGTSGVINGQTISEAAKIGTKLLKELKAGDSK